MRFITDEPIVFISSQHRLHTALSISPTNKHLEGGPIWHRKKSPKISPSH